MPRSSASSRACGLISWAAKIPFTEQRIAIQQFQVPCELLAPSR